MRRRCFQDVTTAVDAGHLQNGHGIANPGHGNAFVGLELEGVRANRGAIGARVAVTVDADAGPRTIHRLAAE
jgi:hypothetical protein